MGKAELTEEIELEISDVSGQKVFSVAGASTANTVGELINEVLPRMNLPRHLSRTSGARGEAFACFRTHRGCTRAEGQADPATEHRCGVELTAEPLTRTPDNADLSLSLCADPLRRGRDRCWNRIGAIRLGAGARVGAPQFSANGRIAP